MSSASRGGAVERAARPPLHFEAMNKLGGALALGLSTWLVVACGEEFSTAPNTGGTAGDAAAGTGGASGVGGAAGSGAGTAGAAGSDGGVTIEEFCGGFATAVCGKAREDCCKSVGIPFDQQECVIRSATICLADAREVADGTMRFDGTQAEACAIAINAFLTVCSVTLPQQIEFAKALRPCSLMFEGSRGQDAACERDSQCAVSPDPNVLRSCDEDTKQCRQQRLFQLDERCRTDGSLCDNGLFCKPGSMGSDAGICRPVTPEGNGCTFVSGANECGIGSFCNGVTCKAGFAPGETCEIDYQCASFSCGADKRCAALPTIADGYSCGAPITGG
jgi:hypothetical protein